MIFGRFYFFIGILLPTSFYVIISILVDSVEIKEMSVLISLLVSHAFGIVLILILGAIRLRKYGTNYSDHRGNTFVKIKLIIVFTFGILYIFSLWSIHMEIIFKRCKRMHWHCKLCWRCYTYISSIIIFCCV